MSGCAGARCAGARVRARLIFSRHSSRITPGLTIVPPVAVIINPISGTGGRPDVVRRRAEQAAALLASRSIEADVFVTERAGHARELTQTALTRGASLVIAWGGDGTINEIASVLAFRDASLGIVPSGSGNGLARELRTPFAPAAAFAVALAGRERTIDAGELDGRLFFNIAGCGLDARVASRFAANESRRGFFRYLEIAVREVVSFVPDEYVVRTDGVATRTRPLMVAFANARQYGNGALIAPSARIDDGYLDLVIIGHRSPLSILVQVPRLFLGQIERVKGVTTTRAREIEVTSATNVLCHLDGEPHLAGRSVQVRIRPRAVRVRC